jgi:iron complex outermembrane recepter protein
MRKKLVLIVLIAWCHRGHAQESDSVKVLQEVIVRSYEADRPLLQVPAAIGLITGTELFRFSNTSLVSAVNTLPGIRMEERSPGSYRFSIRGSSLRAPFGVRNVKVYWNELPLTDPGGNTYLNQLDANAIQQLEIIKGPGSSLYGAGTGGVILLKSPQPEKESAINASFMTGSYGLRNYQLNWQQGSNNTSHYVGYQHHQSDGYRQQTRMVRDQLNSTFKFKIGDKEQLETAIFYTDLYYQTPGGLTEAEYLSDPKQARPPAGTQPGAIGQQASVTLKSFYSAVSHQYFLSKRLRNRTGVFGNFVQFNNPSIRNYERRLEQNLGARSVTEWNVEWSEWKVDITGGGEFLRGYSPVKNYQNRQGYPGLLQSDEEIRTLQYSLFGQMEFAKAAWIFTAGMGMNWVQYDLVKLAINPSIEEKVRYDAVLTPRIALLRKINDAFSVYGNVSLGFSPPTLAEVRPSNGIFNTSLGSEKGKQYEAGVKGYFLNRTFYVDAAVYHFALDETIVVRRDADGADYFVNAGATDQNGLELLLNWQPALRSSLFTHFKLWSGLTLNRYQFKNYVKDNISYSGNQLTGTPGEVWTAGADVKLGTHLLFNATLNYTSDIPLNDANSVFASAYTLLGMRVSYRTTGSKLPTELFTGADNLLDETYSLGNDLNAAAGRYFNAAAGRNFFAGLRVRLQLPGKKE